jgi:hypothetical protein
VALKAIEQNKNYLERTLDFVLKLTGHHNNQSDLGQVVLQCSGSQHTWVHQRKQCHSIQTHSMSEE